MAYTTSINIERDFGTVPEYLITANARQTVGKIIQQFTSGLHSFCLIGSYGTGKSSFLLALENSLLKKSPEDQNLIKDSRVFNGYKRFEFLNIVGDYKSLTSVLSQHLKCNESDVLNAFDKYYQNILRRQAFLVVVIDEFGKILEHAAKNNPEKEMYFLQKFCEYINSTRRNIIFLCTLHQGFSAYAKNLSVEQRQEWVKVKGRIQDIIFSEPVEQLLNLTAQRLSREPKLPYAREDDVLDLALEAKIIGSNISQETVAKLYPLDIVSAFVLTLANQRYGQNERTLFTFLEMTGDDSISEFKTSENLLFNLAEVYDYVIYSFHSSLQEINEDSTNWSAINIAIERAESLNWEREEIISAIKIIKAVGLLNIFAPAGARIDMHFLSEYARKCMSISDSSVIISNLEKSKILRYAKYKSRYILFEGTDVDIEAGLYEASRAVRMTEEIAEKVASYFVFKLTMANAHYFLTGTPRYFQHLITSEPVMSVPKGDIDGYINILFPLDVADATKQCSQIENQAILYCIFKESEAVQKHLLEIDRLQWVRDFYVADDNDRVANKEISKLLYYEQTLLNKLISDSLFSENVIWVFNGKQLKITSQKKLNKNLSMICDCIYSSTPRYHFELINKSKPTGNMSLARQTYLQALLENYNLPDLGFPEYRFPPEKSIFLTLLKNTGIYSDGQLDVPTEATFQPLWNTCEDFLKSSTSKQRKVSELYKVLQNAPFRLKQGFLDCWIPTFLILKRDDYALYSEDRYVPFINKEALDLMLRTPSSFSVKAFCVDGIKMSFFEKYREAINLSNTEISTSTFIETIRPFLTFYKHLNSYAKRTKDISANAMKFRDVIAKATDPEKTFFEELPEQLGFKEITLTQNPEAIESFVVVIQDAIRELRQCYTDLIDNVERTIISTLRLGISDYSIYHDEIVRRYESVKIELMPLSLRNFYNRLISHYDNRTAWIEAITYVPLNKPLPEIKDTDKIYLFNALRDMLYQLDDYVEMHKMDTDNVVRLHITQNKTKGLTKQVVLSETMTPEVSDMEKKIEHLLSGDSSIDVAALINVLKKKIQ